MRHRLKERDKYKPMSINSAVNDSKQIREIIETGNKKGILK